MGRAEEIVRSRIQNLERGVIEADARAAGSDRAYLKAAIPHLLFVLEQSGYPEADLAEVPGPDRRFGRPREWTEYACWTLYEVDGDAGSHRISLLSDGRLWWWIYDGNRVREPAPPAYTVAQIPLHYSAEGARVFFEHAADGVHDLLLRYG